MIGGLKNDDYLRIGSGGSSIDDCAGRMLTRQGGHSSEPIVIVARLIEVAVRDLLPLRP
jgi:hypothetical protein